MKKEDKRMKKKIAKDARITESMIGTARIIFKSSTRLGIIYLLTRMKMSVKEIEVITGDPGVLISHHIVALENIGIVQKEDEILEKDLGGKKVSTEMVYKINEDIRDDLVQIINSFLEIQGVLEKYKQNAVLEKYKREKENQKI